MHLEIGETALSNVLFHVADDELASKYLFIVLPVLQHLRVDCKALLQINRTLLDGKDFADVQNLTAAEPGHVFRQMETGAIRV